MRSRAVTVPINIQRSMSSGYALRSGRPNKSPGNSGVIQHCPTLNSSAITYHRRRGKVRKSLRRYRPRRAPVPLPGIAQSAKLSLHMTTQIQSVIELPGSPPAVFAPNRMVNGGHLGAASAVSVTTPQVRIATRTGEHSSTKIDIINGVSGPVSLTLEIKRGGQRVVALQNVPFGISASPQGEITLNSERQQTPWQFKVKVNFSTKEMSLSFVLNYSGLSVADALEGVRFNKELSQGGEFVVSGRQPITGAYLPIARGDLPSGSFEGEDERFTEMLEELQFIESKTRLRFIIPDHSISYEERASIAAVAQIVRTGHATYHAQPWITLPTKKQANDLVSSFDVDEPLLTT